MLQLELAQAMAIAVELSRLLSLMSPPILSVLAEEVTASRDRNGPALKDTVSPWKSSSASAAERPPLIEAFLVEQIGRVLRCTPSKVDVRRLLAELGIDSLMAVEELERVESDLGLIVPVTALLEDARGPGVECRLVTTTAGTRCGVGGGGRQWRHPPALASAAGRSPGTNIEELLSNVDDLSDNAVDSLLRTIDIDDGAKGRRSQESGSR